MFQPSNLEEFHTSFVQINFLQLAIPRKYAQQCNTTHDLQWAAEELELLDKLLAHTTA